MKMNKINLLKRKILQSVIEWKEIGRRGGSEDGT